MKLKYTVNYKLSHLRVVCFPSADVACSYSSQKAVCSWIRVLAEEVWQFHKIFLLFQCHVLGLLICSCSTFLEIIFFQAFLLPCTVCFSICSTHHSSSVFIEYDEFTCPTLMYSVVNLKRIWSSCYVLCFSVYMIIPPHPYVCGG